MVRTLTEKVLAESSAKSGQEVLSMTLKAKSKDYDM